jgi:small-conductance mechanosensitive channel
MLNMKSMILTSLLLLQDVQSVFARIWYYLKILNYKVTVGSYQFSAASLIEGLVIFVITVLLSRTLSRLLEQRVAKRIHLEPGLRYTIGRLAHYLIISLGALYALKEAFDVDYTSLEVLFAAMSLGIGFGLRDIAADIAGGFILLFERPVRVGDRITVGNDEGDVQSINLRTTVVLTNNRISIIVPNSKMIQDRLINWSYGDPRARIAIPIKVDPGADVDLVTKTLIRTVEGVDNVVEDPPPKVQFTDLADWSNDFRLLVWTNRPRRHMQIRSDINYRIEKLFREAGIETAFPLTQIRLRDGALQLGSGGAADDISLGNDQPEAADDSTAAETAALKSGEDELH